MRHLPHLASLLLCPIVASACSSVEDPDADGNALVAYSPDGTCDGFPKLDLETPPGVCVGLVVGPSAGIKMPRGIVEMPSGELVVAAMGSWNANKGSVWLLTPNVENGKKTFAAKQLLKDIDRPNGIALGPDPTDPKKKRVYLGTPTNIFRFDPFTIDAALGQPRLRVVIDDLPGDSDDGGHPLKQLVFDGNDVFVNVGSSSDLCKQKDGSFPVPCPNEVVGRGERAGIRRYQLGGKELLPVPISRVDGTQGPYEMVARGLRNSMALAVHPTSKILLQADNGRDGLGPELPHEELNVVSIGAHYGWPYCYDDNINNPEYPNVDCSKYRKPTMLLPAHAAPLGMTYYGAAMFPAPYQGNLLVAYHGYAAYGHRLVLVPVDDKGVPTGAEPADIIRGWGKTSGHPLGAPVDVVVASDGSILLTEDKNATVLRVFFDKAAGNGKPLAAQAGTPVQPKSSCDDVKRSTATFATIERDLFDKQCTACHGGLIEPCDMTGNIQRLIEGGKVIPGKPDESELYQRIARAPGVRAMPLNGAPVSQALVDAVHTWIKDGAQQP